MKQTLKDKVERWISRDPDANTRAELEALLAADDHAELEERFADDRLRFGTAGIRGKLGGGPMRMNRAIVIETTDGLARYLLQAQSDVKARGVVIGYDGRRMSDQFATDAARVLAGYEIPVHLFAGRVPTPVLAFAVTQIKAAAGIMITASHNPPEYNGYKLYWANGAQIVPPHDKQIASSIDGAKAANTIPLPALSTLREAGLLRNAPEAVIDAYVSALLAARIHRDCDPAALCVVYTAMHGVGNAVFQRVAAQAGFVNLHTVAAQAEPDGEFPTVRFPNPEERSALKLALALAEETNAEIILANDPDADRLAVCVRRPDGEFQVLTGDETGVLLADYLLTELAALGRLPEKPLVETTIVSSQLLGRLARKRGIRFETTLTGFKWIANRGLELEAEGYTFLFGYEEAIGFTVGQLVRDKDGIGAALFVLEMAAWAKRRGESLLDRWDTILSNFGVHKKHQVSVTLEGLSGQRQIAAILERLRDDPPASFGGYPVARIFDYKLRQVRDGHDGTPRPIELPASNVIAFELADGSRVVARPSGTEPKIKFYFEAVVGVECTAGELAQAKSKAESKIAHFVETMLTLTGLAQ